MAAIGNGQGGSILDKGTIFLARQVNDRQFVPLQKHQDVVIHRIQFLKITNYIPHAAGHQISLLLQVPSDLVKCPSQSHNQSIYLSITELLLELLLGTSHSPQAERKDLP